MQPTDFLKAIGANGTGPVISRGNMFGMPCWKVQSKVFAIEFQVGMVFKLPTAARQKALGTMGAQLWAPFSKRHVKKEWVYLPNASEADVIFFAHEAIRYVSQLASKT